MANLYPGPNSFRLLQRFRLVNFFFHHEPALRYFTLLGASIVLSCVSFYTTFRGFEALTRSSNSAIALSLAIQFTLFWTARELGRKGASWKEALIFFISAVLSVALSYFYIADKLDTQGEAGKRLTDQIQNALNDVDRARQDVNLVLARSAASAQRWESLKGQEILLGKSTPRFRGEGEGGLSDTYTDFAAENRDDAQEIREMLLKLDRVEDEIRSARSTFEETRTFSEESVRELRDAIALAREIYKLDQLTSTMAAIQRQENAIYDEFFKPYEGTSSQKNFNRLAPTIPIMESDLFSVSNMPALTSDYNRAIENARQLVQQRPLHAVLALFLAIGLDFMILLCSFATNYGIPLRVVPNQELVVDALLRADSLEGRYPAFMKSLTQKGKYALASISPNSMKDGERIPVLSLIEKKKINPQEDGFEIAPDLLDYVLRAVYVETAKGEAVHAMEGDDRIDRLVQSVTVRGGKLRILGTKVQLGGWDALSLMDLVERGLLIRGRTWTGKVEYIFSREMIDCCQCLRKAGATTAKPQGLEKIA